MPSVFDTTDDNRLILQAKAADELKFTIDQVKSTPDKLIFLGVLTVKMGHTRVVGKISSVV